MMSTQYDMVTGISIAKIILTATIIVFVSLHSMVVTTLAEL